MLDIAAICRHYELGEPVGQAQRLEAGVHRNWRFTAASGVYMVKEALPSILALPGGHLNYEKPEEIAQGYASRGIAVAAAYALDGHVLQSVGGQLVMLFDWVDAQQAAPTPNRYTSQVMGSLMGRMHADSPRVDGRPEEPPFEPNWPELARRSSRAGLAFATPLHDRLDLLERWTVEGNLARVRLLPRRLSSHRDLTLDNVLWKDASRPVLIDWEGAGPINAAFEAYATAFAWALDGQWQLDASCFEAFFDGYLATGAVITEASGTLLDARAREEVRWLYWCILRALQIEVVDAHDEKKASAEIERTFVRLDAIHQNGEEYRALIERVARP